MRTTRYGLSSTWGSQTIYEGFRDVLCRWNCRYRCEASKALIGHCASYASMGVRNGILEIHRRLGRGLRILYLVAAAGNQNKGRHQNNFGCAVMMFAGFIIVLILKVVGSFF
jgi:hypothetical protein